MGGVGLQKQVADRHFCQQEPLARRKGMLAFLTRRVVRGSAVAVTAASRPAPDALHFSQTAQLFPVFQEQLVKNVLNRGNRLNHI